MLSDKGLAVLVVVLVIVIVCWGVLRCWVRDGVGWGDARLRKLGMSYWAKSGTYDDNRRRASECLEAIADKTVDDYMTLGEIWMHQPGGAMTRGAPTGETNADRAMRYMRTGMELAIEGGDYECNMPVALARYGEGRVGVQR